MAYGFPPEIVYGQAARFVAWAAHRFAAEPALRREDADFHAATGAKTSLLARSIGFTHVTLLPNAATHPAPRFVPMN